MSAPARNSATGMPYAATGGLLFAAVMMVLTGLFQFFQGIAAIAKDQIFLTTPNYLFKFDTTAWGWIHLIIGIVVAVTGFFLFTGATWARAVGMGIVGLQMLLTFFFLPYYPFWALIVVAIDIFIIWALAAAPSRDALR